VRVSKANPVLEPAEPTPTEDLSLVRRLLRPRTLVSFGVGIAILALGLGRVQLNLPALAQTVAHANWPLFLAAFLVYYTTFPIRAIRWRLMLENAGSRSADVPGIPDLAEIIFLSWFANSVVPAKLGDIYRAYLLRQRSAISLSKAGGTIVAERLLDFAVLMLLLLVSGLVSFHGRLPAALLTVFELGIAALILALIGLLSLRRLDAVIYRIIPRRFHRVYDHFHDGMVGSFGRYRSLVALTILAWGAETGRLFLVARSLGLALSPNPVIGFLMIVFIALGAALLTAPPGTPAGLGYVEASISGALILFGVSPTAAVSTALLDRTISFLSLVVGGFIVYLISQRHA